MKIRSIMISILQFFGFFLPASNSQQSITILSPQEVINRRNVLEQARNTYTYKNDLSSEHLALLTKLKEDEQNRLNSIETKISILLSQSSILFALISFFAPLFSDALNDMNDIYKVIVSLFFSISYLFFLGCILVASRIFGLDKFVYIRQSASSVIDPVFIDKELFISNQVKSLIKEINHTIEINNKKASILIYSNRLFISGFITSGLFSIVVCLSLLYIKNDDNKLKDLLIKIEESKLSMSRLEYTLTQLNNSNKKTGDSLLFTNIRRSMLSNKQTLDSLKKVVNK